MTITKYTISHYRDEMAASRKKLSRDWMERIIQKYQPDMNPERKRIYKDKLKRVLSGQSFALGLQMGYINQIRWAIADQTGAIPEYLDITRISTIE